MGHCIHIYNYIQGLYGTLYSYIIIYRVYMGHCIHIYNYIQGLYGTLYSYI